MVPAVPAYVGAMTTSNPVPALFPPVGGRLWARLRRLDAHCNITIQRRKPDLPRWRGQRVWAVLINDEAAKAYDYIRVEHPQFADALRLAVEEAEERGW